jgi:hypothetical protein
MRFAPLGFPVYTLVRCGKDFGEVAEVEPFDECESDGAAISFGPAA